MEEYIIFFPNAKLTYDKLKQNTYSKRGGSISQFKTKSLHSALSPAMLPSAQTA